MSVINVQESFLNVALAARKHITIQLLNGAKLSGNVRSFDKYSIVLETNTRVLVSRTMEYLSNERTLPESLAPFSSCIVMCFLAAKATLRNDSWTLITDMPAPRIRQRTRDPAPLGRVTINDQRLTK